MLPRSGESDGEEKLSWHWASLGGRKDDCHYYGPRFIV